MKLAKPIQIIKKENHVFHLELNEIEPILASEEMKNRHVVIVSIAGDLRKGKRFLLSFCIKYLIAKVKKKLNLLKSKKISSTSIFFKFIIKV